MSRAGRTLLVALVAVLIAGSAPRVTAQVRTGMPVSGVVLNRMGYPAPGLVVQLQHPQLGPSRPVLTSPNGGYYFPYVPSNVNAPYTIEVWWGPNPVFRDYLRHLGDQPPIRLR